MPSDQKPSVLTCQIIVAALIAGVVTFSGFALFAGLGDGAEQDGQPSLSFVMVAVAVVTVLARFVVPPVLVASQRRNALDGNEEIERENFLGLFVTKTIVENALPEGACFMCIVAYVVEGQWWLFAVVGAVVALMAIGFPTQGKFENWYRTQRELADLSR